MLKLSPDTLNARYPIDHLEFYTQGIKVGRSSNLKHRQPQGRRTVIKTLSQSSLSRLAFLAQNTPLALTSMLTLSYGSIYPSDGYLVKKSLNRFLTFLRTRYRPLGYIWFLEFQARGAPHLHILLDQDVIPGDRDLVASSWLIAAIEFTMLDREYSPWLIADTALKMFKVHRHRKAWEMLRSEDGGRGYVTKYATKPNQKEVPKQFGNVGRFWGNSRSAVPKPLSTQGATETGVRLYLQSIEHQMANAEVIPKHISTYKPKDPSKGQPESQQEQPDRPLISP